VPGFAGLAIGITLAVIHIVGIQVTGVSVNLARSFGPAVLAGGERLQQPWLFLAAPSIGAVAGALLFRFGVLSVRRPYRRAGRHHDPPAAGLERVSRRCSQVARRPQAELGLDREQMLSDAKL
jgi:hypothetical protein